MDLDELNELEERIKSLQDENSDLKATIGAVRAQLSVFDSLILYPTYTKQLAAYPETQRPIVELAMKANFYKKSHEIQQMTRASMAAAAAKLPDKIGGVGSSKKEEKSR